MNKEILLVIWYKKTEFFYLSKPTNNRKIKSLKPQPIKEVFYNQLNNVDLLKVDTFRISYLKVQNYPFVIL